MWRKNGTNILFLTWILVSALVIYGKNKKDERKLPFVFERHKIDNDVLRLDRVLDVRKEVDKSSFLLSDTMLVLYDWKTGKRSFIYYNLAKECVERQEVVMEPDAALVSFMDNDRYIYVDRSVLKSRRILGSESDTLYSGTVSVFSACRCDDGTYLCLGCDTGSVRQAVTGFYKLDHGSHIQVEEIEKNTDIESKWINFLSYNGSFQKSGDYLTYRCDVRSLIYVFDLMGNYIQTIHTKDDVPAPAIRSFAGTYIYTRGETFNSNKGCFIWNDFVYVLSYRSDDRDNVVLDKYAMATGRYVGSFEVPELPVRNNHVDEIQQAGDRILFCAEGKFYLFSIGE